MLMYQKRKGGKKRRPHKPSILHPDDGTCYLCGKLNQDYRTHKYLEVHHVFGGNPNRMISETHGFKVKLCAEHHRTGPDAVHRNIDTMRLVQRETQKKYEETHTRKQFQNLIGRNYLDE